MLHIVNVNSLSSDRQYVPLIRLWHMALYKFILIEWLNWSEMRLQVVIVLLVWWTCGAGGCDTTYVVGRAAAGSRVASQVVHVRQERRPTKVYQAGRLWHRPRNRQRLVDNSELLMLLRTDINTTSSLQSCHCRVTHQITHCWLSEVCQRSADVSW